MIARQVWHRADDRTEQEYRLAGAPDRREQRRTACVAARVGDGLRKQVERQLRSAGSTDQFGEDLVRLGQRGVGADGAADMLGGVLEIAAIEDEPCDGDLALSGQSLAPTVAVVRVLMVAVGYVVPPAGR